MKYILLLGLCSWLILTNCGPSAEELEAQRIADSTYKADSLTKVQVEQWRVADSIAAASVAGNFSVDFRLENYGSFCHSTHSQADINDVWWDEEVKNKISIIFQSEKRILLVYFDRTIYKKYNNIKALKNANTLILSNNQYNDIIKCSWSKMSFNIKFNPYDGRNHYFQIDYGLLGSNYPYDIDNIMRSN